MGIMGMLIVVAACAGFGVVLYGLCLRQRSTVIGCVATAMTALTAIGSYYAMVETPSMTWGIGYAAIAAASAIVAVMHFGV